MLASSTSSLARKPTYYASGKPPHSFLPSDWESRLAGEPPAAPVAVSTVTAHDHAQQRVPVQPKDQLAKEARLVLQGFEGADWASFEKTINDEVRSG